MNCFSFCMLNAVKTGCFEFSCKLETNACCMLVDSNKRRLDSITLNQLGGSERFTRIFLINEALTRRCGST